MLRSMCDLAPEKAEVGRFPDVREPHTLLAAGVAVGSPPGMGTPRLLNPPDTAPSPIVPPTCYDQLATLLRQAYNRLKLLAMLKATS